ncbi:MAG: hypothetical protein MUO27_00715 [Sedimentisphaerales bacterium]|nr:hypothetical protein [Sedimentisphaerales bacterium]
MTVLSKPQNENLLCFENKRLLAGVLYNGSDTNVNNQLIGLLDLKAASSARRK